MEAADKSLQQPAGSSSLQGQQAGGEMLHGVKAASLPARALLERPHSCSQQAHGAWGSQNQEETVVAPQEVMCSVQWARFTAVRYFYSEFRIRLPVLTLLILLTEVS